MKKEYIKPISDIYVVSTSSIMGDGLTISGNAGEGEYGDSKDFGGDWEDDDEDF